MTSSKPIGLIIPTGLESRDVLRQFGLRKKDGVFEGFISGVPVLLKISGVGAQSACLASAELVRRGAKMLVSAGFCGALTPNLKVGDLVTERIRSVDTPARTPAEREALTRRANAIAVDMETQSVVEEGTRRAVPIRVLRVVSDPFETDLTPLFGNEPGFSPFRIALRLLWPASWALALQLFRSSRVARKVLADALPSHLARWSSEIPAA